MQRMTKRIFQAAKSFYFSVYRLMSCQYHFPPIIGKTIWSVKVVGVVVPTVSNNSFSWTKRWDQCVSSEPKVWPLAAWKTAMGPYDVTGANAKCNFVTKPGPIKFLSNNSQCNAVVVSFRSFF